MTYKLPKVSPEINKQVDNLYCRGIEDGRYVNMLIERYIESNLILLQPLDRLPKEIADYTAHTILPTIRKLEKAAKRRGEKLPTVTKETVSSFGKRLERGEQENLEKLFKRMYEENPELIKLPLKYVAELPESFHQHILYPFYLTLAHLEYQGKITKPEDLKLPVKRRKEFIM